MAEFSKSDLSILLFNCDSRTEKTKKAEDTKPKTKKVVNEETRRDYVKNVIDKLTTTNDDPNLFILFQDRITRRMDKVIKACATQINKTKHILLKEEAMVYDFTKSNEYSIQYLTNADLHEVYNRMELPQNPFTVSRLMAAVIRSSSSDEILLVSWHGPYKENNEMRKTCFETLVKFLGLLQDKQKCSTVIVGGDFNFPSENARTILKNKFSALNARIDDDYDLPQGRQGLIKNDYIILWPSKNYSWICKPMIREPDERTSSGVSPFDHPIVLFRFRRGILLNPGNPLKTEAADNDTKTALSRQEVTERQEENIADLNQALKEIERLKAENTDLTQSLKRMEENEKELREEIEEKNEQIAKLEKEKLEWL